MISPSIKDGDIEFEVTTSIGNGVFEAKQKNFVIINKITAKNKILPMSFLMV
jgi:hypothetical protein